MIKSSVSFLISFVNSVIAMGYIITGLIICAGIVLLYFAIRLVA